MSRQCAYAINSQSTSHMSKSKRERAVIGIFSTLSEALSTIKACTNVYKSLETITTISVTTATTTASKLITLVLVTITSPRNFL